MSGDGLESLQDLLVINDKQYRASKRRNATKKNWRWFSPTLGKEISRWATRQEAMDNKPTISGKYELLHGSHRNFILEEELTVP